MLHTRKRSALRGGALGDAVPLAVSRAADRFNGLAGSESESGVALVLGLSAESHVADLDGESVVDLGHRVAVDGLAVRDVRAGPAAAVQTFRRDPLDSSGEFHAGREGECHVATKDALVAGRDDRLSDGQRRAVGREDGPPSALVPQSVRLETDEQLAAVGRRMWPFWGPVSSGTLSAGRSWTPSLLVPS